MAHLLFGLETEYAVAAFRPGTEVDRLELLDQILDHARRLVHLPDANSECSLFLGNGARFYVDGGAHPEYCTPEVANPWELVRYTQAGHRTLQKLLASVEAEGTTGASLMCHLGNVDYSGSRNSWGSHESYLHQSPLHRLEAAVVPHLVTRIVYTGAGGFNPLALGLEFTLAPRVAHLTCASSGNSTGERGIWHTKCEPLGTGHQRLHVLCGESLCSHWAAFLRAGVTALVVALADAGVSPGQAVQLADPLAAMRTIAADVTCRKPLRLADGGETTALEVQRHYLELAIARANAELLPDWAPEVCRQWREVLDLLEGAPGSVAQTLDWGIKWAIYRDYASRASLRWDDLPFWNELMGRLAKAARSSPLRGRHMPPEQQLDLKMAIDAEGDALEPALKAQGLTWADVEKLQQQQKKLFEIDTRFGQLGPEGIFQQLDEAGVLRHRISGLDNIEEAVTTPPAGGRAYLRGIVIQRLAGSGNAECEWDSVVDLEQRKVLNLSDPFTSEEAWSDCPEPAPLDETLTSLDFSSRDLGAFGQYSRRQRAFDLFARNNYAGAEELLRGLLAEGFEEPSTRCHLARIMLLTNRQGEAREQVTLAWAARQQGPDYMPPRILFLQCLFAMLEAGAISPIIAEMKTALGAGGATLDWTIQPVLDHFHQALGEPNYRFLEALSRVLCGDGRVELLEEFAQWGGQAASPAAGQESARQRRRRR